MKSTIKMAAAAMAVATGLVGCGDMEDGLGDDGAGSRAGTNAEEVTTVTSPLTSAECSARVISRGNEPAVRAIVGNLVSTTDLITGVRGDYTNNASIYCTNATGLTKFVIGLIRAKYHFKGAQNFIGYPTTDEEPTLFATGRFNFFQSGIVLWKNGAPEAFEIHGAIRSLWVGLGNEWGEMGFPTGDETAISNGRRRNIFEFGRIFWTSTNSAWPVMTSTGNPSDRLANQNRPRITSASMQASTDDGCLSASGAAFTAGRTVELRLTNPNGIADVVGHTTVRTDGTFSFTDVAPCTDDQFIKKVNGVATVWAVETSTGKSAVAGFFTSAGDPFVGTM
jgi:hypothetical protein